MYVKWGVSWVVSDVDVFDEVSDSSAVSVLIVVPAVTDHTQRSNVTTLSTLIDAQGWASECPNVKNYKWRLNPVCHWMHYSCTHTATVGGVKELKARSFSHAVVWRNLISCSSSFTSTLPNFHINRSHLNVIRQTLLKNFREQPLNLQFDRPSLNRYETEPNPHETV